MALPGVTSAMTTAMNQPQQPNDAWTRDWLRNKGFTDNEIGFDTNKQMITVRNNPFIQATSNVDGKSYAPVSAMQEAYNRLNPLTQGPGDRQQRFRNTADTTLADLMSQIKTPFSYDPSTDPRYTAGVQLAQSGANKATKSANEQLNSMGLLTPGSIPQERANQIQQSAMSDISARLVPELYNTALQQHNTEIGQMSSLANMLAGTAVDERNFAEQQKRADQSFGIQEGSLTGNYTPQNVKDLVSQIINAKQNNATGGNAQAGQQANDARAALERLGIDANGLFGANVDLNTAMKNANGLGTSTLAQKQFKEGTRQFDERNALDKRQFTEGTRQFDEANALNKRKFEEDVRQYGLDYALQVSGLTGYFNGNSTLQREALDQKSNDPSTPGNKNDTVASVIGDVDQMTPDNRKKFFTDEKTNIIAELGVSGYNQLLEMYFNKGDLNDPK